MKVLVLNNHVPFVSGGAEELSRQLVRQLRIAGHEAEEMGIPFSWSPPERLIDEIVIGRSLRVVNVDRIIALKFPAYLVEHERKVIWLLHQFRQAYDLFDAGMTEITRDESGDRLRSALRSADEAAFRGAYKLFAIPGAASRLSRYHRITSEVLSSPLNDPELFFNAGAGDYIFAGGRVNSAKRQALLIEALKFAPDVKLIVAGPAESEGTEAELRALAIRHGVADRVKLDIRFLPRSEVASLVNHCKAAAYLPFDEDSVGYVTMEAFQASKPVISTTDAGGVLDIVSNGVTGLVTSPTPKALGDAMTTLWSNPELTLKMGEAARQRLDDLDLSWPKTLKKLLA